MQADKEKVYRLLKTAKGQIDGLIKMVEMTGIALHIHTAFGNPGDFEKS